MNEQKIISYIACNSCKCTNKTMIKAIDSYYCKDCFNRLNKQKFKKGHK